MSDPSPDHPRVDRGPAIWAMSAAVAMAIAIAGSFWIAPEDVEGPIQRLLFLHVPIAVISLLAFGVACVAGIMYLRTRDVRWDDLVVASCGVGMLFIVLGLISGSIWARGFWGTWWQWDDVRLVTYLLIGLIYAAFFVLRSSAEDSQKARFSAVYAIIAFASVPLSFWAVRTASSVIHPEAFDSGGLKMDGETAVWFVFGHVAVALVFWALVQLEVLQRRTARRLADLRARLEDSL